MYIIHTEKVIEWNAEKAEKLKEERNIDMEEIAEIIRNENIISIEEVPNQKEHPNQRMYVLDYNNYTICVPFVYDQNGTLFLKTAFPSRVQNKKNGGEK